MMCAWKELLGILPQQLREEVDKLGREQMQELRLRINSPPELVLNRKSVWLTGMSSRDDLNYVINTASRYSPWNTETTAQGYITAPGGHRIGLCGEAVCRNGCLEGVRELGSLCIRVARDFPGIGDGIRIGSESMLVLGAPGWGKTTLLRDLARRVSENQQVAVLDERKELFPNGFQRGRSMDVMQGCPKNSGVDILLRTMGPECIVVDEITAEQDCNALLHASNCGVRLLASAHASSVEDFLRRTIYQPLIRHKVFDTLVVLHRDRTYFTERMDYEL